MDHPGLARFIAQAWIGYIVANFNFDPGAHSFGSRAGERLVRVLVSGGLHLRPGSGNSRRSDHLAVRRYAAPFSQRDLSQRYR